ncbi:tyrosine-protein phosphatase [Actinoplanes sp. CA-142083]|uniref:tyrosine-protein phosphatase n=1 Tax=Actinoplanes sp. CA-142083 TaxID=3239903 RepID=UPI003D93BDED
MPVTSADCPRWTERSRARACLYRTDALCLLTEAGVAAVRKAGVTRIIDLRWQRELDAEPGPFAGDPIYRHVPMLEDVLSYEVRHETYGPMLDFNRERIAAAFAALATAPAGGGVIVHCQGGRDRTGVLVALALAVAGVSAEEIVADYGRSPERPPIAMANTLEHLESRYGGAFAYLREIGVSAEDVEAVRVRLRS